MRLPTQIVLKRTRRPTPTKTPRVPTASEMRSSTAPSQTPTNSSTTQPIGTPSTTPTVQTATHSKTRCTTPIAQTPSRLSTRYTTPTAQINDMLSELDADALYDADGADTLADGDSDGRRKSISTTMPCSKLPPNQPAAPSWSPIK